MNPKQDRGDVLPTLMISGVAYWAVTRRRLSTIGRGVRNSLIRQQARSIIADQNAEPDANNQQYIDGGKAKGKGVVLGSGHAQLRFR